MKKFYSTLALAALCGGSMLAAPAVNVTPGTKATMSSEGAALYRAEQAYAEYVANNDIDIPGMQRKSWTDANGNVWNAKFYVNGTWAENFTTWEDNDYYVKVQAQVVCASGAQQGNAIYYVMFYPTKQMWQNPAGLGIGDDIADTDPTPLDIYISKLSSEYGFAVPQNTGEANRFYIGMTDTDGDNSGDCFVIMNSNTPSGSGPYFAATSSMGRAIYNKAACGPAEGSRLALSNYDPETSSINMHFYGTATNASGATAWTYDINYSGFATMVGFSKTPVTTDLAELHIVNCGVQDYDNNENYDVEWAAPLQTYYFIGCNKYQTVSMDAKPASSSVIWWSANTYPTTALYTEEAASIAGEGANIHGTLFSKEGVTQPYGNWNLYDIKITGTRPNWVTTNAPIADTWVDGNWIYPYSENNGTYGVYQGIFISYDPTATHKYMPFIMNGTTEGFGIQGVSRVGATVMWKYSGNIIYHNDPTDYTKTTTLSSVGTLAPNANWLAVNQIFSDGDNNVNVVARDGQINVTVDEAANVAIYNMAGMIVKNINAAAGQTVNVEVGNGLYIVKVGNKAVKVIL